MGTDPELGSGATWFCREEAVVPPVEPSVRYLVRLGNVQVLYGGHPPELRPKPDSVTKADSDNGTQAICQILSVVLPIILVPTGGQTYPEKRSAVGVSVGGQAHSFGQQLASEHVTPEAAVVCAAAGVLTRRLGVPTRA